MRQSKYKSSIYSLKYNVGEFFYQNKVNLIMCLIFTIIGLLTGIFTAIKVIKLGDTEIFESFNLTYQLSDLENFSSNFFNRLLSYGIVELLLFVFSLFVPLYFFAWCLIGYRIFLVAINCVMIALYFSFSGVIKSLLIIFPCQLIMLILLIVFFCYISKQIKNKKYCNYKKGGIMLTILVFALCLTIVNVVETILLFIFRSNVILVI